MIHAITFDAVGTLIVPHPGVGEVYAEVAAAYGVDCPVAVVARRFPAAFAAARAAWSTPYGADEDDARRFWARVVKDTFPVPLPARAVDAIYQAFAHPGRWRVLPGVRAALAVVVARDLPCAVVSNFDCRLEPLLAGLGLGPFTTVITSAEVGRAKPDPELLFTAARHLCVQPHQILHVGDNPVEDGAMAAAAGTHFQLVPSGEGIEAAKLFHLLCEARP
jgi:putative hydrolase of the HAD superfamily